jgi:hypothetical protein
VFLQRTIKSFIIKTDYKNLIRFLTIKELNQRQVRWAEILIKYYFEIEHIKSTDNIRANILSKKAELQNKEKLLSIILRINKDRKIRYNYL